MYSSMHSCYVWAEKFSSLVVNIVHRYISYFLLSSTGQAINAFGTTGVDDIHRLTHSGETEGEASVAM